MIRPLRNIFASKTEPVCQELSNRDFQKLKSAIHEELVGLLDLSAIGEVPRREFVEEIHKITGELCSHKGRSLNDEQKERMFGEIQDEIFGLGPLEPLMQDHSISDILVNRYDEVYIERRGRLELTDVVFADDQHVMRIIQRIAAKVGRRVDEVSPMVDARLPDGSRVNAVLAPLALNGSSLSIRRFGSSRPSMQDLVGFDSISADMAKFLSAAVESRLSMMVSGGAGAGKTTLLNALAASIPDSERLITIEDSAELLLRHRHVVRLETRVANTEGTGQITQRDLVKNSLRMRPDRIIVGEVRGSEALDMLQAMNTGHEGSLTTIHANDAADAVTRLEMMVAMTGLELPMSAIRKYIAAGIRVIVHLARFKGGKRRVVRISEIIDSQSGEPALQDIFVFEQTGVDNDGNPVGEYRSTGYLPRCLKRIEAMDIHLPNAMFDTLRIGSHDCNL